MFPASSDECTDSSDVCTASSGVCTASSDVCTAGNDVCTLTHTTTSLPNTEYVYSGISTGGRWVIKSSGSNTVTMVGDGQQSDFYFPAKSVDLE